MGEQRATAARHHSRARRTIDSLDAAHALFAPALAHASDERLYVAHLDRRSRLIGVRLRYGKIERAVDLPLRAIVADAVALGSHALLLAHSHPSGDPSPSETDIEATRLLVRIARPLDLRVRDHLVFGGAAFVSLRAEGLL